MKLSKAIPAIALAVTHVVDGSPLPSLPSSPNPSLLGPPSPRPEANYESWGNNIRDRSASSVGHGLLGIVDGLLAPPSISRSHKHKHHHSTSTHHTTSTLTPKPKKPHRPHQTPAKAPDHNGDNASTTFISGDDPSPDSNSLPLTPPANVKSNKTPTAGSHPIGDNASQGVGNEHPSSDGWRDATMTWYNGSMLKE